MRSATARRFALVAAMVVSVPFWFRAVSAVDAPAPADGLFVGMAVTATVPAPAIRRIADPWPSSASAHGVPIAPMATLLALLLLARWARLCAAPTGVSPLARRRHVIALRAPPAAAPFLIIS
ncbi:MAG TPA: hypothetical protein VHF27_13345 [Acidimicrobiales bacterium]|nr:hypothetical protein [Acidimicrobiales bacterium]